MLNDTMQKALNEQINAEIYSAYLYYAMSAHCEANDLPGFASWFKVQAQEELFHASKFFDYINDRDGRVELTQIATPPKEWDSPLSLFQAALEHERHVTGLINALVDIANKESDYSTYNFLQWFVSEQVEEEATAHEIIGQIKLAGSAGGGLFMLDRELGARTFTPPTTTAE